MTHIELYKKYRPTVWGEIIGQDRVVKSLQVAVTNNKIPTAYLFSGDRGCGKTSAALILAKAVNCEDLQRGGNPCNQCETCKNIDEGTQLGVTYISAAYKSSVDDVRQLVIEARIAQPVKVPVFIIDEAHNYRQGKGFEALLIPLEAVDMNALFIFCTTEIEKIPATILSRTQSRKFNLVNAETMTGFVSKVVEKEGITATEEQIASAVMSGRGSVRDTLSAFEEILSTGEVHTSHVGKLVESLGTHEITKVLASLAEAVADGNDCRVLAEELFEEFRNLLLLAVNVDSDLVGVVSSVNPKDTLKSFINRSVLMKVMGFLGTAITQMSTGNDSRITLEIALIKSVEMLKQAEARRQSR